MATPHVLTACPLLCTRPNHMQQFGLNRFKEFLRQKERLPEILKEIGDA